MIELPQGRPAPGSCPPHQKLTALVPPEISRKTRTCAGGFHLCGSRFHQIYPTVCKGKAVWSGSFLKFELATLGIVYIHPQDLCSWYKAFKDLFCSMLVVKPWQESIPVPQREAQPLSQFRLSQHSHEHQMEVLVASNQSRQREANPSLFISRTHGARKSFFLVCRWRTFHRHQDS